MSADESAHSIISSYFIGPKAENLDDFQANIIAILDELRSRRLAFYGDDEKFITDEIRKSPRFVEITRNFGNAVRTAARLMGKHSVPFWSPRYEGHMCTDMTMPALLGYFMTMIYNPNNVTVEASPFTTVAELKAGEQLCQLFGYNTDTERQQQDGTPIAWGHITCDGTVANLESIWVARNLKFYPLALYQAMKEDALSFIADTFKVTTCMGEEKLFQQLSVWELLNLRSETILGLADALNDQFGITSKFLETVLDRYNIQSTGKEALEKYFGIDKPIKYFLSKTRHYSWPKGGAIAGIGSGNMHGIELGLDGHIDLDDLEAELERCLQERQAVYAVVAIMGSTEEGAVDRLSDIIEIRHKFQAKGLSFLVHADAAWGGYFATMLPRNLFDGPARDTPVDLMPPAPGKPDGFVPSMTLREDTVYDMAAMRYADSITVDPHKAGYIPYPAGSLLYRDGRMRYLVTWTSPYLSQGSSENIGVYGVEGSKPGAAAMATWLSHKTIGLNPKGYGRLLGEAAFTSARLSAHYAAMHINDDCSKYFICIPFNRLPKELEGFEALSKEVNHERKEIGKILSLSNREISEDPNSMQKLRQLGSDLNINAFALNWLHEDGTPNHDIEEANYFMKRIVDRLSVTTTQGDPTTIPLYLTSTSFEYDLYGKCSQHFMKRLQLDVCKEDLFVLRNVVMSPFPTDSNFISNLMKEFKEVARQEVEVCRKRNSRDAYQVEFVMAGTEILFLDFQASFHRATQRQQIILEAALDPEAREKYQKQRHTHRDTQFFLKSVDMVDIQSLVEQTEAGKMPSFKAKFWFVEAKGTQEDLCTVTLKQVVKSCPLNSANRDESYPKLYTPFYLYGTQDQKHISHMLLRAPNAILSARDVSLNLTEDYMKTVNSGIDQGLILTLSNVREACLQPLPKTNEQIHNQRNFFFQPDRTFDVKIWYDPNWKITNGPGLLDHLHKPIASGTMTLGKDVYVDVESPNKDPFEEKQNLVPWEDELNKIEDVLNGGYVPKA